jgi:hypothetical protein
MNIRSLTVLALLYALPCAVAAQSPTDPLYIDKDGNIYMRVKGPKKLTVDGAADFSDSITVNSLRTKKQLSVGGAAVMSDSVRILRQLAVGGNTSLSGNVAVGSTTQRSNLDVSGDAKIKGGLTIGSNEQRSNLDVSGQLKISGGAPGEGKTLTSDASGLATWQKGARRDFRPYGNPSFYWGGFDCNNIKTVLEVKGSARIIEDFCKNKWVGKFMVKFDGMSTSTESTTNGIFITLPATADVHNNLLISTIDFDRWAVWTVWLCDANKNPVTKLAVSSNNARGSSLSSTYTIGPFNNPKETPGHGWIAFPINASDVKKYISGGKLKFLIAPGPKTEDGRALHMSGLALVPNPYGFMQQPGVSLHWGLNGEKFDDLEWGGLLNNDGNVKVRPNSTATIYVKVIDPDKDLLVTFHENNGDWAGGSLNITVGTDATVFRPSAGIIGIASTLYSSYLRMRPESIIIPAAIVKAQLNSSSPTGVQNVIMLKLQNTGDIFYGFHGVDTEIY